MRKLAYLGAVMLVLLAITAGAFHLEAQAKSATDDKAASKPHCSEARNLLANESIRLTLCHLVQ